METKKLLRINTYANASSAILTANLPTVVPPNFCTIQGASGSELFWCILDGVIGLGDARGERDLFELSGGLDTGVAMA